MPIDAKLYIMVKPPAPIAKALGRCRHPVGLHDRHAEDRLHCTILDLGDAADWPRDKIARLRRTLDLFAAEPFEAWFDQIHGRTLLGQPGMAEPRLFHADLKRHLGLAGFALPLYIFRLHLNLAYTGPELPATMIDPVGWLVEDFRLVRIMDGRGHEELGRWTLERRQFGLAL